jgi:hypothetical protein
MWLNLLVTGCHRSPVSYHVLNVHSRTEDKIDDVKYSYCKELNMQDNLNWLKLDLCWLILFLVSAVFVITLFYLVM